MEGESMTQQIIISEGLQFNVCKMYKYMQPALEGLQAISCLLYFWKSDSCESENIRLCDNILNITVHNFDFM